MSRRERNKAQTRRRISDAATALFMERGFDDVSVSDVADAADVARPTVFAHFPRKEDLLLDRFDDTLADLEHTVRERATGSALTAVAQWVLRRAEHGEPPVGVRPDYAAYWKVVANSRALQARARELTEVAETRLASAIADTSTGIDARLAAALTIAAVRTVHLRYVTAMLTGDAVDDEAYLGELRVALHSTRSAIEHYGAHDAFSDRIDAEPGNGD